MRVNISVKAQIISLENELQAKNISQYKLENRYDEYKRLIRENIQNDIEATWAKMIETNSDYCNIQDLFYGYLGNEWKNNRPETDTEMLSAISLDYDIDVNVISGGLNKRYKLG